MKITDIKIKKLTPNSNTRMRGIASITLDNALVVHDIKIIEGTDRLFLAMPSRKTSNGEFQDIVHPITPEARKMIEEKVIAKYKEIISKK